MGCAGQAVAGLAGRTTAFTRDADGNLYAATGPTGELIEITPDGKHSVLLDSDENNLLCLAGDGKAVNNAPLHTQSMGQAAFTAVPKPGDEAFIELLRPS